MTTTRMFRSLAVACLAGGALVAAPARAVNGTPNWVQSQVGAPAPGYFVSSPSLAFDHYGTPAVSWSAVSQAGQANFVRHSHLLGLGFWSTQDVTTGVNIGLRTSLAFDRAERPTIAWVNGDGSVRARFNYGAVQNVAPGNTADISRPALALSYDLAGDLKGVFTGAVPGQFHSIRYSGGSFSSTLLASVPGVSSVFDAVTLVDHHGLRHIAARIDRPGVPSNSLLLVSEPPGGGAWPFAHFVTADGVNGVDLAIDPTDGRLALAYTTYDNATGTSKLFYAKSSGVGLQETQLLSSTSLRFDDLSMAFDLSDGRPAIAFERKVLASGAEELAFTFMDGGGLWQTTLVDGTIAMDAPGGNVRKPSLAFDDFGTSWPAIAYVDAGGELVVAFDPPVPEPATLGLLVVGAALLRRRRHGNGRERSPRRRESAAAG